MGRAAALVMGHCGRPQDIAAYSVVSLESGPLIAMITLGGILATSPGRLLGAILPLLAGIALGFGVLGVSSAVMFLADRVSGGVAGLVAAGNASR